MTRLRAHQTLALVAMTLFAQLASASDALSFFNNWFVTGDYAVAGVGLRGTGVNGWATGTINMSGVPADAEPIAAFLYWSTVETSLAPSAANGYFNGFQIQGAVLGDPHNPNPACLSNGSLGPAGTNGLVYRADILRYLPVNSNNIRQANGGQIVKLPDSGASGNGPSTNGASLVVIYRIVIPGVSNPVPYRAIVIYNGAFSMNQQSPGLTQNVAGFYQAASFGGAKMSTIVANGQPGFSSALSVNGQAIGNNPFIGAQQGPWDNPTFNFGLSQNASSFSTLATAGSPQTCLTFAAIVFSVSVQDSDNDGLLDIWETKGLHRNTQVSPATFGTCSDYPAEPCVNLPVMGASPSKQDIFVQIDWMHGTGDGTGGIDGHGTHDHMPQLAALSAVANSFAAHNVNVHFDVGSNYQGAQAACGNAPCSFIVPSAYAQGGADIDESTLVCHDTANHTCDYHVPYPVLSFEFGFASIRDGNHLLNISPHFAQNRKDSFHYALFAHALGGPFNAKGQPVDPFSGQPTNMPKSYSGIAHRPGGGFMVTLGLWRSDIPANDQVGSVLVQSGTLMHELGHNLGLGHAGKATTPNCMPNYPSVMNYLYQTRGLTDSFGNEQVDYSNGLLRPLNEGSLFANTSLGNVRYRVRYYGPLAPNQPAMQAAQVHCDGTPIKLGEAFEVRLEGPTVGTPDWSNGTIPFAHLIPQLDVNYDGNTGQLFRDQPDWYGLNLLQIASGYSFGGLSVGAFATDGGAFATDGGAFATDAGALATDGGAFATDGGAFATDGGAFATDGGAFATDGGAFATDGGAFATDAGELDEATMILSTVDPPPPPTATNTLSSIVLNWTPPATGAIQSYNIYRCAGIGCIPSAPAFKSITGGSATPSFTDSVNDLIHAGATCPAASTCYNTTYTYSVTSVVVVNSSANESLFSKTATSEVTHLYVIADGLPSVVYGGANPTPTFKIYGDVQGSLAGVSCAFSPAPARNAATYAIVCSGPSTTSPTDGVTYNQPYLVNSPGTYTITQRPITVTAAPSSKVYDATLNSPAMPTITSGSLAYNDAVTWIETYDNKNVGTTHIMTPSGVVNDGNGGNNYNVTFVNAGGGVITPAPASVTPNALSKIYGTPDPTLTGTLTGFVAADGIAASYSRTAGETVPGSPYIISATLSPVAALSNYTITYNTANFTINPAPASVTPNPASKTYGTADPVLTGTLTGFLAADHVTATYSRTAGENVAGSPYTISAVLNPAAVLVNYNVTYNTATFTITKAPAMVSLTNMTQTYTGATLSPTVTTVPAGLSVMLTGAPGTNAGSYPVTATVTDPNYVGSATGTFVISPFLLTVTATGVNRSFDGTANATVTLTDNRVSMIDTFTDSYASASFSDPNPGTGKKVTVSGISISGTGAANYALKSVSAQTTANISNSIDLTRTALNGSPQFAGSTLRLTNNVGQTGSAWLAAPVAVTSGFSTSFSFRISGGATPDDGFAFVIQNNPNGTAELGAGGGNIGYGGIPNSIAIEFDPFSNHGAGFNDPPFQHIAIQSNGIGPNSPDHGTGASLGGPYAATLADGNVHTATITYNASTQTLSVILDGSPIGSAVVDLSTLFPLLNNTNAYAGFTAATDANGETADILSWTWN